MLDLWCSLWGCLLFYSLIPFQLQFFAELSGVAHIVQVFLPAPDASPAILLHQTAWFLQYLFSCTTFFIMLYSKRVASSTCDLFGEYLKNSPTSVTQLSIFLISGISLHVWHNAKFKSWLPNALQVLYHQHRCGNQVNFWNCLDASYQQ